MDSPSKIKYTRKFMAWRNVIALCLMALNEKGHPMSTHNSGFLGKKIEFPDGHSFTFIFCPYSGEKMSIDGIEYGHDDVLMLTCFVDVSDGYFERAKKRGTSFLDSRAGETVVRGLLFHKIKTVTPLHLTTGRKHSLHVRSKILAYLADRDVSLPLGYSVRSWADA